MGLRGPFGTPWPVDAVEGPTSCFLAGGIGLAPLRPALYHVLAHRERYGRVVLLFGARTPHDILFTREIELWRGRFDITVEVVVDRAAPGWHGFVGVVTSLVPRAPFDPSQAVAMVCGPEIMMKFGVQELAARGVDRRPRVRLARAQHEVRGRSVRALPVRADVHLQGRPGLPLRHGGDPARHPGGVTCDPRAAQAGRLEVRLVRRLPADAARLRGRAARDRRRRRDRELPRGVARRRPRALRHVARRGLDHHAARCRADPPDPPGLEAARHHRRVRDERRHPGAAQFRGRARVDSARVRVAARDRDAPHVDADREPRRRWTSSWRVPDQQGGSCSRPLTAILHGRQAGAAVPSRLRRLQGSAARSASSSPMEHPAWARSPAPGAGRSARRSAAAATGASARSRARTSPRSAHASAGAASDNQDLTHAFRSYNAGAEAFRKASESYERT